MELVVHRTYYEKGTNSVLFINGQFLGFVIELPWKANKRNISCVPEGTYKLKARFSEKFGHHLLVSSVEQRSLILIHPANDALKELQGCLAPVTYLSGIGKGTRSKHLLQKIVSKCYQAFDRKEPVYLTIKS